MTYAGFMEIKRYNSIAWAGLWRPVPPPLFALKAPYIGALLFLGLAVPSLDPPQGFVFE
jgi:hypothetical protein